MDLGDASNGAEIGARQRWMELLARASADELEVAYAALALAPAFRPVRGPETGLVMVQARAGGTGAPFHLGEMTVTRCTVALSDGSVGHGYVAGRDGRRAELAALFDALMQAGAADPGLLDAIENRIDAERREEAAKVAATRVDFFTLVRGESG